MFTIDVQDVYDLWDLQKGVCAYTGVVMSLGKEDYTTVVSIDRRDNANGYTRENIVLCTSLANTLKHDKPIDVWLDQCGNTNSIPIDNGA